MPVNVRILATTNRSLSAMVADGSFRTDLYYRLNVVPLALPPLRERPEDIPELVQHFLKKHGEGRAADLELTPDFLQRLQNHSWPGNVRELENTVRRALALSLKVEAWKEWLGPARKMSPSECAVGESQRAIAGTTWEQAERELLVATLEATHGNRTRAAEMLGLSVRTVRNKIRQYQLPRNPRPGMVALTAGCNSAQAASGGAL